MMVKDKINQAIESASEYILDSKIDYFQFKQGREKPRCSILGAIILHSVKKPGCSNFMIPHPATWKKLILDYLQVGPDWLDIFSAGYFGDKVSPMWMNCWDLEQQEAFSLGKEFRIKSKS